MKQYLKVCVMLVSLISAPAWALEQRGELVLNKIPLFEIDSPLKLACTELFDVKKSEDVPDLRVFRNYPCQGRYEVNLRGEAGGTVTVFGDFEYGRTSGFLVVVKTDDKPVWIESIDNIPAGQWVEMPSDGKYGAYKAFHQAAPRFSQSLSSIKWGKWWDDEIPTP